MIADIQWHPVSDTAAELRINGIHVATMKRNDGWWDFSLHHLTPPFVPTVDEGVGIASAIKEVSEAMNLDASPQMPATRWQRDTDRAILYFGEVPVADITPFGNGYQVVMGCRVFAPGGITQHESLDEAVAFVDGKVGRSDER